MIHRFRVGFLFLFIFCFRMFSIKMCIPRSVDFGEIICNYSQKSSPHMFSATSFIKNSRFSAAFCGIVECYVWNNVIRVNNVKTWSRFFSPLSVSPLFLPLADDNWMQINLRHTFNQSLSDQMCLDLANAMFLICCSLLFASNHLFMFCWQFLHVIQLVDDLRWLGNAT